jgi:hypothetical protein
VFPGRGHPLPQIQLDNEEKSRSPNREVRRLEGWKADELKKSEVLGRLWLRGRSNLGSGHHRLKKSRTNKVLKSSYDLKRIERFKSITARPQ